MICPHCQVQMHQQGDEGSGTSTEDYYETWTIQVCPACDTEYKEFYSAQKLRREDDQEHE